MTDLHRLRIVENEEEANETLETMEEDGYRPVDTAISHQRDSTKVLILFERHGYSFEDGSEVEDSV